MFYFSNWTKPGTHGGGPQAPEYGFIRELCQTPYAAATVPADAQLSCPDAEGAQFPLGNVGYLAEERVKIVLDPQEAPGQRVVLARRKTHT